MKQLTSSGRVARALSLTAAATLWAGAGISTARADAATVADDAIWVHDALYGTVATVTAFKSPPPGTTDVIFSFGESGLEGQRSVAESAPGDMDYNGGRWNVMLVKFTSAGMAAHDPDGDGNVNFELTNAEQVLAHAELGHLEITAPGVYFECPLRPQRGR